MARATVVLLLLAGVAGAAPQAMTSQQELQFESVNAPEQLVANSALPKRTDWGPVYEAWRSTFDPESAQETQAALELLVNGHPDFVAYTVPKLRAANGPLASLSPEVQSRLANAPAIALFRLRERTAAPFIDQVRNAVHRRSATWVPHMLTQIDGFERLPGPVVLAILDLLEVDVVKDPAGRQAFEDAILQAGELGPAIARLQTWRSNTSEAGAERRIFALAALARVGQPLTDAEYVTIIETRRASLVRPALRAVRGRPLSGELLTAVGQNFIAQTDLETWQDGLAVLQAQRPDVLDTAYRSLTLEEAVTWPPEVLAAFVESAPDWAAGRMATLGYEQPAMGTCRDVPLAAAVLDRRAALGMPVGEALVAYGRPRLTDCRAPMFIAFRNARRLHAAMNSSAEQAFRSGEIQAAADLANLGATLRAGAAPANFWQRFNGRSLPDDAILRVVQAMPDPPEDALESLATLVAENPEADTADRILLTLAAHDGAARYPAPFAEALAASRPSTARTAAVLLTEAYAQQPALAPPNADVLDNVRTGPHVEAAVTKALLGSLAARGPPFDAFWAERENKSIGEKCAPFMVGGPLRETAAIQLLNEAFASPGLSGDALKACVLTVTAKSAPIRELAAFAPPRTLNNPMDTGIRWWRVNAASTSPAFKEVSSQLLADAAAARKRDLAASLTASLGAGVPLALLLHLALWAVLLTIYPHSPAIQSVVFWNPLVRRVLGLGYIDVVLIYVPWARRKLLQPFRTSLLGDILRPAANQLDRIDYYPESRVTPLQAAAAAPEPLLLVEALSRHKGRVVLIGQSGLGKSSFLRFWLSNRAAAGRDEIVYLRADECRGGVEAEIERRMQGLGHDQRLVHALIYSSRLFVYIDGYNEVEVETQDAITRFLADHPYGNILICTQILLRGFHGAPGWRLLALERDQATTFLRTRAAVIPDDAPLVNEDFEKAATAFLEHAWPVAEPVEHGFAEALSNPMDLTSVALLLARGRTPDLFGLEAQQFDSLQRAMKADGIEFRLAAFSAELLKQRIADQENLEAIGFSPEVAALANAKMAIVRTFADQAGRVVAQETRFRHDRIRDFFTHFAFLDLDLETVARHAADARFSGVYAFLARSLSSAQAEDLRERLIRQAAEFDDHRVSDSFVREYDWRRRSGAVTLAWFADYDLPDARAAEAVFKTKIVERQRLQSEVDAARARMADARNLTNILLAADSRDLLDRAAQIYRRAGAELATGDGASESVVRLIGPDGRNLSLAAVAQAERIGLIHVQLALAQLRDAPPRRVLVTNSAVVLAPNTRAPDLDAVLVQFCHSEGVWPIEARDLYALFLDSVRRRHPMQWAGLAPVVEGAFP